MSDLSAENRDCALPETSQRSVALFTWLSEAQTGGAASWQAGWEQGYNLSRGASTHSLSKAHCMKCSSSETHVYVQQIKLPHHPLSYANTDVPGGAVSAYFRNTCHFSSKYGKHFQLHFKPFFQITLTLLNQHNRGSAVCQQWGLDQGCSASICGNGL